MPLLVIFWRSVTASLKLNVGCRKTAFDMGSLFGKGVHATGGEKCIFACSKK